MKEKIGGLVMAIIGGLMAAIGGRGLEDMSMAEVPALFLGPGGVMLLLGLVVIGWRAWNGDNQNLLPKKDKKLVK